MLSRGGWPCQVKNRHFLGAFLTSHYCLRPVLQSEIPDGQRGDVIAVCDGAGAALAGLLDYALWHLPDGFAVSGEAVTHPGGVSVALDRDDPLLTLSRIVQEDLCVLQKQGDEHVLMAALLCFPVSWTLAQKIGKPLLAIHVPVVEYKENIAKRVQRLFDRVQVGRPLWRCARAVWQVGTANHPASAQYWRGRIFYSFGRGGGGFIGHAHTR
jgi:hypothetical protein